MRYPVAKIHGQDFGLNADLLTWDTTLDRMVAYESLTGMSYPAPPVRLGKIAVVVDIGAHVGASTVWFHSVTPRSKFYCFEPNAESFSLLKRNMDAMDVNATLANCGLSDADGESWMRHDRPPCETGISSTSWRSDKVRVRCAASSFRALGIRDIGILKVDTEGSEVPILRSIHRPWLANTKMVYVEFHSASDHKVVGEMLHKTHRLTIAHVTSENSGVLGFARNDLPCIPNAIAFF